MKISERGGGGGGGDGNFRFCMKPGRVEDISVVSREGGDNFLVVL